MAKPVVPATMGYETYRSCSRHVLAGNSCDGDTFHVLTISRGRGIVHTGTFRCTIDLRLGKYFCLKMSGSIQSQLQTLSRRDFQSVW